MFEMYDPGEGGTLALVSSSSGTGQWQSGARQLCAEEQDLKSAPGNGNSVSVASLPLRRQFAEQAHIGGWSRVETSAL